MSSKLKLHARRRAQRFGDLDLLLAEALKDQRRGEGAVKRLKGINQTIHEQFSNPQNWTDRGVMMVIYVDEKSGEQTTVGLFQYQTHRTGASRMTRVQPGTEIPVAQEHIPQLWDTDPYLVRGKVDPCPQVPKGDHYAQLAIRDYLARTKEVSLAETLGVSSADAGKLLAQLKSMGVEKLR